MSSAARSVSVAEDPGRATGIGRSLSVAGGVARRNLRGLAKTPPKALAPLLVPLFFFASFKGALAGIGDTPGFDYYDFTAFEFVIIFYMAAMLAGVFTAIDISIDFESGLGRRLMAAAPQRMAILAGYLIVSLCRCVLALVLVSGVVLVTGLDIRGGAPDIAALVALALLLNVATTLYGAGVSLRFRDVSAGSLVNIPVFMVLFLTPLFTPRDQLADWLQPIAGANPITPPIEAGRGFLANDPVHVALAFACAGGLVIVFAVWAFLGMRDAEKG
jgi:ABC-2 type transport system permease protein